MSTGLKELPLEERIKLVEELWDSISADQENLKLTAEQRAELDRRLEAFEIDGKIGRPAQEALSEIRKRL
jgi:putative addiction module component (TIGR02574 family)